MKRANIFITLLIIISLGSIYYYLKKERDHTIRFTNTPETILQEVKIYAMMQNSIIDTIDYDDDYTSEVFTGKELPDTIEYKNGWWYQNGKKAVLVFDGKHNYGLSRNYLNPLFYITINDKYFVGIYKTDHPKGKKGVFDYNFTITPVAKHWKYEVGIDISHHGRRFWQFPGFGAKPLKEGLRITGTVHDTTQYDWNGELTKEQMDVLGFEY